MMRAMIFGCGYSGTAIARTFAEPGNRIFGTTRSIDKLQSLRRDGIEALLFDGTKIGDDLRTAMTDATHLIQSIPPGKAGDPLVRQVGTDIRAAMPKLEWIGYLSTVGVYGDHRGAWVDEDTPLNPVSDRSIERVAAEEAWLSIGRATRIPVAILRLAGIYGPGRNALCNIDKGTARRIIKKDQVFNRIRVEDIADAARFLCDRALAGVYNVTDDEPGPPQDVIAEAAGLMGVEPPLEIPFETAELSPMARSFYGENKRVSNRRLRAAGFQFSFPNYRMSLRELWSSGRWKR
jgi:nucleoside-diphosphate-sugar epimerase